MFEMNENGHCCHVHFVQCERAISPCLKILTFSLADHAYVRGIKREVLNRLCHFSVCWERGLLVERPIFIR